MVLPKYAQKTGLGWNFKHYEGERKILLVLWPSGAEYDLRWDAASIRDCTVGLSVFRVHLSGLMCRSTVQSLMCP